MKAYTLRWSFVAMAVFSIQGAIGARAQSTPAAAPAQAAPYSPSAADVAAKIKDLKGQLSLLTLQLGPDAEHAFHLLFEYRAKKQGDGTVLMYWAPTVKGGLGNIVPVKRRAKKMEMPFDKVAEATLFSPPPVTTRSGELSLTHTLQIYYIYNGEKPYLTIEDNLIAQRGPARSAMTIIGRARPSAIAPVPRYVLWGLPIISPDQIAMANPPEYKSVLRLKSGAFLMIGTGSVGPLSIAVTELGSTPTVTERETLSYGPMKNEFLSANSFPTFVMKKAKPLTDYRIDFTCPLGPALGTVSNSAKIRTEQIINKVK